MKKIILLGAFIAMSFVSCSKDNVQPTQPKTVATANVTMDVKVNSANPTGKSVNRGNLYAWISEIDVTAISKDFNYQPQFTPFVLVNDAAGTVTPYGTVEGSFTMNNIAVGNNEFDITTKTSTTPQCTLTRYNTGGLTSQMNVIKANNPNPYAIYSATIPTFTIVKGVNTLPQTTLNTTNGRGIATFELSPALASLGVTASISSTVTTINSDSATTIDSTHGTAFYWSNSDATDGKTVTFTITLKDKNGNSLQANMPNPLTVTMTLVGSTSINNSYVINEADITTNSATDTFIAQPWTDVNGGGNIGNTTGN